MRIVYIGPLEAVDVPAAGVVATRGETVDIADDVAAALLLQDTWEEPRTVTRKKES